MPKSRVATFRRLVTTQPSVSHYNLTGTRCPVLFRLDLALYKWDKCGQPATRGRKLTFSQPSDVNTNYRILLFEFKYNMGQQGSKSSIEARVIFHSVGTVDMYQRIDACCTPSSVVHIQKKVTSQPACLQSSPRAIEKSTPHSWTQSRCDAGGLVYVMDNPTGGVWVKPGENWLRSWFKT